MTCEHETLRQELNNQNDYITDGIITRSKATWLEEGEKNTKYFLTLERRRKTKTHVRKLLDDKMEITNPKDI